MTRQRGKWGRVFVAAQFGAALAISAAPAWAQLGTMGGAGPAAGPLLQGSHAKSNGAKPPPSALQGAKGGGPLAPASVSPAAMDPTTALFDAINRNDVAAARDALSRGADLRGHNVLGMTPLQLSIDLGRNAITFALLSMHEADASGAPPAGQPEARSGAPVATVLARAAPSPRAAPRASHPVLPRAPFRPAAMPLADGGTPAPGSGFMGFDPSR